MISTRANERTEYNQAKNFHQPKIFFSNCMVTICIGNNFWVCEATITTHTFPLTSSPAPYRSQTMLSVSVHYDLSTSLPIAVQCKAQPNSSVYVSIVTLRSVCQKSCHMLHQSVECQVRATLKFVFHVSKPGQISCLETSRRAGTFRFATQLNRYLMADLRIFSNGLSLVKFRCFLWLDLGIDALQELTPFQIIHCFSQKRAGRMNCHHSKRW